MTQIDDHAPSHKRIRLDPAVYARTASPCSVTIAVKDRRTIFSDPRVAAAAVEVLRERAATTGVAVLAYCFMPDHVPLVLDASPQCDITTFVGQLKNLVQRRAWACGVEGAFWQKSFFDHFLRGDEDLEQVVAYVVNNPVRAGLVEDWRRYPYSGSLVFEL